MSLAGAALAAAPPADTARPYRDGAPAGFSGGFGEDSCWACHFDGDLNEAQGRLTLSGTPTWYTAGTAYPLTVTLVRPGMAIAGFQMTARYEDGSQAGTLTPLQGDEARIGVTLKTDTRVQYAHQRGPGTGPAGPGTAHWTVVWTAPTTGGDAVLLHVSANAADGDESASGDFVYTTAAASLPQ